MVWRRKWQSTLVFLPGKSHGQKSLVGYSPWSHKSWTPLRQQEALARGPRAFDGRARTVAEGSRLPGLLILASVTRYVCKKLESKTCLRAPLVAWWWGIRVPKQET